MYIIYKYLFKYIYIQTFKYCKIFFKTKHKKVNGWRPITTNHFLSF